MANTFLGGGSYAGTELLGLGLRESEDIATGLPAAFGGELVDTLIAFEDVAFRADLAADFQAWML